MLTILINAYACSPNMGSEPGMAWNWCINLAQYCELHIITEEEFRNNIENTLPSLSQGKNMHFYYNPVSDKIRRMCWNQGDWRFYYYYKRWQYRAYKIALDIINATHIDIIHQLNMIGFREPGYLWKIDKPFVWGPVDAKEDFPITFLKEASVKTRFVIHLKNFLTRTQLRYDKRIREAVNKASILIAASSEAKKSFDKYFHKVSFLLNETGCYPISNRKDEVRECEYFNILWVGKFDFRKQLGLAIKILAGLKNSNIRLHIVGDEKTIFYQNLVKQLNVSELCIWYGKITHKEVQNVMLKSDILLFTSVAEGTPHVVLEALGNQLPVICFNTCGQGDSINDSVGVKVELTTPKQSSKEFIRNIEYLFHHKEILQQLSHNCIDRQKELSWNTKALQMKELYQKVLVPKI